MCLACFGKKNRRVLEWFGREKPKWYSMVKLANIWFFCKGVDQKVLRFFQVVKAMRFMKVMKVLKIMKITKIMKVYEKYIINGIFTQVTNSYIILPSEQFLTKKNLGGLLIKKLRFWSPWISQIYRPTCELIFLTQSDLFIHNFAFWSFLIFLKKLVCLAKNQDFRVSSVGPN